MPYKLIALPPKVPGADKKYAVKNTETGQYKAKHTSKKNAQAQMRLLEMMETNKNKYL